MILERNINWNVIAQISYNTSEQIRNNAVKGRNPQQKRGVCIYLVNTQTLPHMYVVCPKVRKNICGILQPNEARKDDVYNYAQLHKTKDTRMLNEKSGQIKFRMGSINFT